MKEFRYIDGVATLRLDPATCIGCGMCASGVVSKRSSIRELKSSADRDAPCRAGRVADDRGPGGRDWPVRFEHRATSSRSAP